MTIKKKKNYLIASLACPLQASVEVMAQTPFHDINLKSHSNRTFHTRIHIGNIMVDKNERPLQEGTFWNILDVEANWLFFFA